MSNTHQTLYGEPRFLSCVLSTMKWCESCKESWKKIRLLKLVSKCTTLIFAIFFWPKDYIAKRAHRWQHSVVFLKSNTELTIFTCTRSSPTDIQWLLSRAWTPENQRTWNTRSSREKYEVPSFAGLFSSQYFVYYSATESTKKSRKYLKEENTGCLKKLSFSKLSIWRSCCQMGRIIWYLWQICKCSIRYNSVFLTPCM